MSAWDAADAGVVVLPSGRAVRGRGLRRGPAPSPPDAGVYLLGRAPEPFAWPSTWLPWRDFRVASDRALTERVLREVLDRAGSERVEVACRGGRGRTGTALACLAVLDGVPADQAVAWVRAHYDSRAVETPWQRRWVRSWTDGARR